MCGLDSLPLGEKLFWGWFVFKQPTPNLSSSFLHDTREIPPAVISILRFSSCSLVNSFPVGFRGEWRVGLVWLVSAWVHTFPHTRVSQQTIRGHIPLQLEGNWDSNKFSTGSYEESPFPLPRPIHIGIKILHLAHNFKQCPPVNTPPPHPNTWLMDLRWRIPSTDSF